MNHPATLGELCRVPESAPQAWMRRVVRALMQGVFRTTMRDGVPLRLQRPLLRALSSTLLAPGGARRAAGTLGGVPCEQLTPGKTPPTGREVLFFHGGAYIAGSPASHRSITTRLAAKGGLNVHAIDYRLAPEHPAPAAVEDALAAWKALLASGCSPDSVAFVGDSAGGNLVLSAALAARDAGLPLPGALVCLSPWTDLSGREHHSPPDGDPMLHPSWGAMGARLYSGGLPLTDPALSPVYADLHGLPPLLIQVGEDEILLNDSLRLAERATASGVAVSLERFPGHWHVFQLTASLLPTAAAAIDRIVQFLDGQLARPEQAVKQ